MASLDHSMHFYDNEIDTADWLLYHMEAACTAGGRGVVRGQIHDKNGKLCVVLSQEGVIRYESRQARL